MAMLVVFGCSMHAQTYKVGSDSSGKPQAAPTQSREQSLGFGSNIQNARLAHGAEAALKRGDYTQATDYAQRAARAAPNDPQLWFLLGYAARLDRKYGLSAEAYSRGLRLKPSLEGQFGLAQTYSFMGRTSDAERLLKQVLASDPSNREAALLMGNLSMKAGDYTGALEWLGRAERVHPDARSELLLAISYQHLKQMDMASHYLELAKRRAPDNPDIQRSLAGFYRETGNYPEAIAALKTIRNPKPDVTAELAYTYQLNGNLDQSAKLYVQAADALPQNMNLQLSAAQAEIVAGSIKAADPFLKRAEKINPDYYRLHAIRGKIAQIQEQDSDAVREYSNALGHLPENPIEGPLYRTQLHMNLMDLYRNLGDDGSAQEQLQTAQKEIGELNEQGADRVQFLRLRALIRMNVGQLDNALADMKEVLALSPRDPDSLQLDGDLLVKLGRTEEALKVFKQVLAIDAKNRYALTSLGYAYRSTGDNRNAEKYFKLLAKYHPSLYVPYLALGDLYTARRDYKDAQTAYAKGYALAPDNALIVAGGMNAAIEAHHLKLAGTWLHRVTDKMQIAPQVLREKERYFNFEGDYAQSAALGREAIKVLPKDRDVVVYLGYDLLHLGKYDELLQLTAEHADSFPQDPDIMLLAGHAHKHDGHLELALQDFTTALQRDPNMVTAYVNRGYVLNDLSKPDQAATDFEQALKREPNNGIAHLGLAYAYLKLNRSRDAVRQSQLAEKANGDSGPLHVIRATAYGREGQLTKAADEYRAALKFTPDDGTLYLALGNIFFAQRRYDDAIDELQKAAKLSPNDAAIYALTARAYAHLQNREQTLRYVQLAEQHARQTSAVATNSNSAGGEIFVQTGQALTTLGDQKAAMDHFRNALSVPHSDRVGVRLAIARLMVQQGNFMDAQRQIALAQMEAQSGNTMPPTGEQFLDVAGLFQQMHEYKLSQKYFGYAKAAGAPDMAVRVGMANSYLAQGDTTRAAAELAAVKQTGNTEADYAYLLAQANVYQQSHQGAQALTAFAQAVNAGGEDQTAQQNLLRAGANEGYRVNSTLSLLGNFLVQPIFEDTTVYVLDAKLNGPVPVPPSDLSLLPPPRSSINTQGTVAYHLHLDHLPTASGFFQVDNARGTISVPQTGSVVDRNTTNTSFNFGLDPTVHLGTNALTFHSGIQGTIRRDSVSPKEINQNLFRAFTYMSTSSFFNVISATAYGIWEVGPFTESDSHSKTTAGAVDFRVGAPWGKTALITGWGAIDQQFKPNGTENYYTSSYVGLTRRFSQRWNARVVAEDLRAWRIFKGRSGIAQVLRPAGTIDFSPNRNWDIQASFAYSNNRSFHPYDAIQSNFAVSYTRSIGPAIKAGPMETPVRYPVRFSAGFQQETFFHFTPGQQHQFRPYVSVTLF